MSSNLQEYFNDLSLAVNARHSSNSKICMTNILNYFEDELTTSDIDFAVSTIFNEETGILSFIRQNLKDKNLKDSISAAFDILILLVEQFKARVHNYVGDISKVCMSCLYTDVLSKEKSLALQILIHLVSSGPWSQLDEKWLAERLLRHLDLGKHSGMVLEKLYPLLGLLAKQFPELMSPHAQKLQRKFFSTIEFQTTNLVMMNFRAIAGALQGIDYLFYAFGPDPSIDTDTCNQLYRCLKIMADPGDIKVRPSFRVALNLFCTHGSLVANSILKEYKWWHTTLLKWLTLSWEDMKSGISALETFYKEIAQVIKEQKDLGALRFFVSYFNKTMQSPTSQPYELRLAIRGFGMLAGSCRILMSPTDVIDLFNLVLQRTEQIYLTESPETYEYLADYIFSLSLIVVDISDVTNQQISALQRLTTILIRDFPKMSDSQHSIAVKAIISTFNNISNLKGSLFNDFIEKTIYQGIIWTCSHDVSVDTLLVDDDKNDKYFTNIVSYKSYLPLWLGLLDKTDVKLNVSNILIENIYEVLLKTLLKLISKLDLTTKRKEIISNDSTPYELHLGLKATKPVDFKIFINLVDLYKVLLSTHINWYKKWIHIYCYDVISNSYRLPLVSGFYKLLAHGLELCEQLQYFNEEPSPICDDQLSCFLMIGNFLKECLVRLEQFTGDLQISCIQTLLIAPLPLVPDLATNGSKAFEVIFKVGRSYIRLADIGLTALERWSGALPKEQRKILLLSVLPHLAPFLESRRFPGDPDVKIELLRNVKKPKFSAKKKKQIVEGTPTELALLQRKILLFLGQLDSSTSVGILSSLDNEELVSWNVKKHLKFLLPCTDIKPYIYLDKFLPRVITLVLKSSDRRTKVTACELLHSIMICMLATGVQIDSALLKQLYKNLLPVALQLACDPDSVVVQLYDPLMMQMTHWMSSAWKLKSVETAILIETLMEGVSHKTDTVIRDSSAKYLREFMIWSRRQLTTEEMELSPLNMTAIVRQICSYSLHPSSYKRLGAAIAFNNIYTILRENKSIVDEYWPKLLYSLMTNLMLTDDKINMNSSEILESINHLERVFRENCYVFNTKSIKRKCPPDFEGVYLKDIVIWILKQCSCTQGDTRHKSMELFSSLAPVVEGAQTSQTFINNIITIHGIKFLISIAEGKENLSGINLNATLLNYKSEKKSFDIVLDWLSNLLIALDVYYWYFDQKLVKPNLIINDENNTKIIESLNFFINDISGSSPDDMLQYLKVLPADDIKFHPKQRDMFYNLKCTVIVRSLNFIASVVSFPDAQNACYKLITNHLWNQSLYELINSCIMKSQILGFDLRSFEVSANLLKVCDTLLTIFIRHVPQEKLLDFEQYSIRQFDQYLSLILNNVTDTLASDTVSLEYTKILIGIHTIAKHGNLTEKSQQLVPTVGNCLLMSLFNGIIKQTESGGVAYLMGPTIQKFASMLMSIACELWNLKDNLVEILLNDSPITIQSTSTTLSHGQYFLIYFKEPIFKYLIKTSDDTLIVFIDKLNTDLTREKYQTIVNIIVQLLSYIYNNKIRNPVTINKVLNVILSNWQNISQCVGYLDILELFTNVAMIVLDKMTIINTKAEGFNNWCIGLLSNDIPLEDKSKVLQLLPCITGPEDRNNEALSTALKKLQAKHFPIQSSEFPDGSMERAAYVASYKTFLDSAIISGSPVLLERIIAISAGDSNHVCEDYLQEKLPELLIGLSNNDKQVLLMVPFNQISSNNLNPNLRLSVLKRFLMPMLQSVGSKIIEDFFVNITQDLLRFLNSTYNMTTKKWDLQHIFAERFITFSLIEILVFKLKPDRLVDKACPVVVALANCPAGKTVTGKEMLQDLSKRAFKARVDFNPQPTDIEVTELYRLYQCAAYKALCGIICNTRYDIKFYTGLLFHENATKREYIWRNIVDCNREYSFPQDFDEMPKRKEHLLLIRQTAQSRSPNLSPKYIESQNIFSSSLSQDVTKFDLTHAAVRSNITEAEIQERVSASDILLYDDSLNTHECMAVLCGVISHMVNNNISPLPEIKDIRVANHPAPDMPLWMNSIHQVLTNTETPKNVKLFLLKLIDNCQNVFRPYSAHMLQPIMAIIVDGHGGSSINCFITDIIAMLLSWHDVAIPSTTIMQRSLATQLLEFIMRNVFNEHYQLYKFNILLIKNIIEIWQPCLDMPLQFLYSQIQTQSTDTKINQTGIQLAGIVLGNNLEPWSSTSRKDYIKALVMNLNNKLKQVYEPVSEVIGMTLKNLTQLRRDDHPHEDELYLFQCVKTKLEILKKSEPNIFITCLYCVFKYYPDIANDHVVYILYKTAKCTDEIKSICLQIILSRLDVLQDQLCTEVMTLDFTALLKEKEVQHLVLHIINKLLPYMEQNIQKISFFMSNVYKFIDSKNSLCRDVMYEISMWIFDKFVTRTDEQSKEILDQAKGILLNGLSDTNEELKERVLKYLNSRMPDKLDSQFIVLLNQFYISNMEENYLGNCMQLVLETALMAPDCERKIFEHPLSECKFQPLRVKDDWRAQHSTIIPLFAESLASHFRYQNRRVNEDIEPPVFIGSQLPYASNQNEQPILRATQQIHGLSFDPTVANDLFATTATYENESFAIPTLNYMMFDAPKTIVDRRTYKPVKVQNQAEQKSSLHHLRQRFLRDRNKISRQFAAKAIAKKKQIKHLTIEQKRQKESSVTIYRQYKVGDFPDVQITSSAILKPLQALAKRDTTIARQLFIAVFTGISKVLSFENLSNFTTNVNKNIQSILKNTQDYNPAVMATMFEVALSRMNDINLKPNTVSLVAQSSRLMPLGALLLEQQLLVSDQVTDVSPPKRDAMEFSIEDLHWLRIAELYQSLSQLDVTHSIFATKMFAGRDINKGLEEELTGDYQQAQRYYQNVITSNSSVSEKDFCYESYYKCFAFLGQWDFVKKEIQEQINSVEELWCSSWYREKVLPWYITSELHRIMSDNGSSNEFLNTLETWMKDAEKANHIKTNFSVELSMLYILNNNFHSARYYAGQAFTLFLEEWSHLSPLSIKLKMDKLLNFKKLIEIQMFLDTVNINDKITFAAGVHHLTKQWSNSLPLTKDSTLLWENIITYRSKFGDSFKLKLNNENIEESQFLSEMIDNCKLDLDLFLLDISLDQKNIGMAKKYIRKQNLSNHSDSYRSTKWKLARGRQILLQGQMERDPAKCTAECIRSWKVFEKVLVLQENPVHLDTYLKTLDSITSTTQTLRSMFLQDINLINSDVMNFIQSFAAPTENCSAETAVTFLKSYGLKILRKGMAAAEDVIDNPPLEKMQSEENITQLLIGWYLKLGKYCKEVMENSEDNRIYIETLVTSILKAMTLGSVKAIQLFPLLLPIINSSDDFNCIFAELSQKVPEWMFIQWGPQLLALLDSSNSFLIAPILIRITEVFPRALQYPFRISYNLYKYDPLSEIGQYITRLKYMLMVDPVIDTFISSCQTLCLPKTLLKYKLVELHQAWESKDSRKWREVSQNVMAELFLPENNLNRGIAFDILKNFKQDFESYIVKPSSKAAHLISIKIEKLCKERPTQIKDFCPWLDQFFKIRNADLEIPGQYTGLQRPQPENHIKILKFNATAEVILSARCPIKISILGNDSNEHIYLIKYGEDLRQDQRIQQLFTLMNQHLYENSDCRIRKLSIETYQVAPLTQTLGIIQWITETHSLRDLLYNNLDIDERKVVNNIGANYTNWLTSEYTGDIRTELYIYGNAAVKYNRDQVVAKYSEFEHAVPWDLLKSAFQRMSVSPESYFSLRHNFATSYAVMCVAHWLLGIGDRHLSNCLISGQTGRTLGIDFGHAFGTATQSLQVPELIPFRLTPRIMNMMKPMSDFGVIPMSMCHTLRTLRESKDVLHATMSVFIHEPLLDWVQPTRLHGDHGTIDDSTETMIQSSEIGSESWVPHRKIQMARRKLNGSNPVRILRDEIRDGILHYQGHDNFVVGYIAALEGHPMHNIRVKMADKGLTVDEQVKCLIDLATDPNILGRTFRGWEPWM